MTGERHGLGVGLDLPWRGPYGIVNGRVTPRTMRFFAAQAHRFAYVFVSWQPQDRSTPKLDQVTGALDPFFDAVPIATRALHQTALNLAGADYERGPAIEISNRLAERYGMVWVNEDLGSWSVRGRPLPYPQPPPLTERGVDHCSAVCAEVDRQLHVPLVVEFPGFETPAPWLHGELDAYDVFRRIVENADVQCNLDTGHLLTWRWLLGHRGEDLLGGLDRLPLDRCVEIHCAGTLERDDALIDAHHGVLSGWQLTLAERLMERCPNLKVVTYEDPRFNDAGELPGPAAHSLDALESRVTRWMGRKPQPRPTTPPSCIPHRPSSRPPWEDELQNVFLDNSSFAHRCRRQLLTRSIRGLGTLTDAFPKAIAAWRASHPEADDLDPLVTAFLGSAEGCTWSSYPWAVPGRCLEDAFGRFLAPHGAEHLRACTIALATHPDPPFALPEGFSRVPRGWFRVGGSQQAPVLYAALGGKIVQGPITPLVVAVLGGDRPSGTQATVAKLSAMGLLRAPLAQVP
jgi:uncharacterized protein